MNPGRLKIALICFDNPFLPPAEGGKRGMLTRMYSLLFDPSQYEVDIYLHNKRSEGMATDFKGLDRSAHAMYQFPMNRGLQSAWGVYPICVNKRFTRACASQLKQTEYDVAIYEGEQVAKYRLRNVVRARRHILYMHDIESAYRAEMARSHEKCLMSWVNRLESLRFRWIEGRIPGRFDHIWFVSKDECETFSQRMGAAEKCEYIPFPALELAKAPASGTKSHQMLYVGDLTVHHNYLSMAWFAREVLPLIKKRRPEAGLTVIGRIGEEAAGVLRELGAEVCGYVDDLDAAYDEAACVVAPVLFGAGVKVKTVDALARGQIVVTTAKGIEGTALQNGKHLIAEDDPAVLAEACCGILSHREDYVHLAKDGLAYVQAVHTIRHQADVINRRIDLLMADSGIDRHAEM